MVHFYIFKMYLFHIGLYWILRLFMEHKHAPFFPLKSLVSSLPLNHAHCMPRPPTCEGGVLAEP